MGMAKQGVDALSGFAVQALVELPKQSFGTPNGY